MPKIVSLEEMLEEIEAKEDADILESAELEEVELEDDDFWDLEEIDDDDIEAPLWTEMSYYKHARTERWL